MKTLGKIEISYAKAVLKLCRSKKDKEAIISDMCQIQTVFENHPKLSQLLNNPTIQDSEKKQLIGSIFSKLHQLTQQLIAILFNNRRLAYLHQIANVFGVLHHKESNTASITVVSAVAMSKKTMEQAIKKVQHLIKGSYVLNNVIDPSLLGGFIIKFGDIQYDASLIGKLSRFKQEVLNQEF